MSRTPIKIAIVGSRTFSDAARLARVMAQIRSPIAGIVSGGARGADTLGAEWALANGIPLNVIRPDWQAFGRSAGFRRNKEIVDHADAVIAFWDGISCGTKNTIDLSRTAGKPVHVVRF